MDPHAVREWMTVTREALESAAGTGTVGISLIQCESLSAALRSTLGEGDWGPKQEFALQAAMIGLSACLPSGVLDLEAKEVLSSIRGAFEEVVRDFDSRHPR